MKLLKIIPQSLIKTSPMRVCTIKKKKNTKKNMYIHTHTKYFPKKKRDRVSTGPGKKKKTVESKSSLSKKKKKSLIYETSQKIPYKN